MRRIPAEEAGPACMKTWIAPGLWRVGSRRVGSVVGWIRGEWDPWRVGSVASWIRGKLDPGEIQPLHHSIASLHCITSLRHRIQPATGRADSDADSDPASFHSARSSKRGGGIPFLGSRKA